MAKIYNLVVNEAIKLTCVGKKGLNLKKNDWCIIRCHRYEDYGRIVNDEPLEETGDTSNLPRVKRHANLVDQGKAHENAVRSKSFQRIAAERIAAHGLPMDLVSTHYTFDRSLVIFLFTAPGRVDFRELLKDLNRALNVRVELRQIGPRDQASIVGGIGTCGRPLCCATFLSSFVSINVRMAKEQGMSLSPSTIIGSCGRLKCCVNYEYEGYKDLMKRLPRPGTRCRCEGCDGRILECNALTQSARVALNDGVRIVDVPIDELDITGSQRK